MASRLFPLLEEILLELRKLNETKNRPKQAKLPLTGEGLPPLAVLWNKWKHESLPRVDVVQTSGTRFRNLQARWNERKNEDFWVGVIRKINASSFCLGKGEGQRKWKADIDFLVRPDTAARVLEGKYDDAPTSFSREKRVDGHVFVNGERIPVLTSK